MRVMRIAQVPPPTVPYTATIKEAIPKMEMDKGCALAVVKGKRLAGTLSKDDVLRRVIANDLDPDTTTVGEVMTWPSLTVTTDTDAQEALSLMFSNHQCYLPVVDLEGSIKGWLAICHLFQNNLEDLNRQLDSIEAYLSVDGPGG